MSYEKIIDELIGQHIALFELELAVGRRMCCQLADHDRLTSNRATMPYGYPIGVYRPLHICQTPQVKQYIAGSRGALSNGVPRVLRMNFQNQYILGVYNPTGRCPFQAAA
jgi:hypothetical protein